MKNNIKNNDKSSYQCREAAWKHFEAKGVQRKGHVLHHKDVNMKTENPERYYRWNIKDLIPMTRAEHRRLHMSIQNPKGRKFTKRHKQAIQEGMKNAIRGVIIKIHRQAIDEDTQYFDSMSQAARYIGCTRQLVSQCLSDCQGNKRACGYEITVEER